MDHTWNNETLDNELVSKQRGKKEIEKEIQKAEWDTEDQYFILQNCVPGLLVNL